MSLINDALKQARKDPPSAGPGGLTPLQPVPSQSSGTPVWLLASVVILLIIAAILFIGWAVTRRNAGPVVAQSSSPQPSQPAPMASAAPAVAAAPQPALVVQQPSIVTPTAAQPQPTNTPQPPVNPPFVLKLQGIDYSAKAPSAILNGKTVRPGDVFHDYRVKSISQDSVTLVGPDNKQVQIEMGN